METIFYVLFRSKNSLHDRMNYFSESKTLYDYMVWQAEQKQIVESTHGHVSIMSFDIKQIKK